MRVLIFLVATSLLTGCLATTNQSGSVEEELKKWDEQAAVYPGDNQDLSVQSKRAIMLGRPELAEDTYLAVYNNEWGRKQFGSESIYQIFLVYIDRHNSARDLIKAKFYLDKMNDEWPEYEQTQKAQLLYDNTNLQQIN